MSGTDYAPQYDFSEFYAATNGRTFEAVVVGNPFPSMTAAEMRQRLLPVMQANKPSSDLTFIYCRNDLALSQTTTRTPASGPEDPRVSQAFKQVFLELFNPFVQVRRPPPFIFMPR